jgi:uncharacterized protein
MNQPPPHPRHHWRYRLYQVAHYLVSLNNSPQEIARGMAVGMVVGFSPLYGFQMIIAATLATLLKGSRAVAIIPVWITNPLTALPIYSFTYGIGRWMIGGPGVHQVYDGLSQVMRRMDHHDLWELIARFGELLKLGGEVLWPMTVGGLVVGLLCAAVSYPLTLYPVRYLRRMYHQHKQHSLPVNGSS